MLPQPLSTSPLLSFPSLPCAIPLTFNQLVSSHTDTPVRTFLSILLCLYLALPLSPFFFVEHSRLLCALLSYHLLRFQHKWRQVALFCCLVSAWPSVLSSISLVRLAYSWTWPTTHPKQKYREMTRVKRKKEKRREPTNLWRNVFQGR